MGSKPPSSTTYNPPSSTKEAAPVITTATEDDGFAFINVSGDPGTRSRDHTKAVKSHVMRRVRGQTREARNRRRDEMRKPLVVPYFTTGSVGPGDVIQVKRESDMKKGRGKGSGSGRGTKSHKREGSLVERPETLNDLSEENRGEPERISTWDLSSSGMRERQEERIQVAHGYTRYGYPRIESIDEDVIRQLTMNTNLRRRQLLSPARMDAYLSPYEVLPIPVSARVIMFLHSNLGHTIRTSVHADPTGKYFSYYIDEPARLYMLIAYSAAFHASRTGQHSTEGPYYFSKALKAINENLADENKRASDSMIGTVGAFANIENLSGSGENSLIHINALLRMVELRGGLHNINGMHGILRRMTLWSDLLNAARSHTAPCIPFQPHLEPQEDITIYLPSSIPPNETTLYPSQALAMTILNHSNFSIISILQRLHELTIFLNAMPNGPGKELPMEAAYPDRVYIVEYQILTALAEEESTSQTHNSFSNQTYYVGTEEPIVAEEGKANDVETTKIFPTLLHASILYIYTNLRQTPIGGAIRIALVTRLQSHLMTLNLPKMIITFPAEMLWILMLGIVTAFSPPPSSSSSTSSSSTTTSSAAVSFLSEQQRMFWSDFASCVCDICGLWGCEWEDGVVRERLREMPVLERVYEGLCKGIWEEFAVRGGGRRVEVGVGELGEMG